MLLKRHFCISQPILVCAHTNVAVDLIISKAVEAGLKPLRFGHVDRVDPHLQEYTYSHRLSQHPRQAELQRLTTREIELENEISDLSRQNFTVKEGQNVFDTGKLSDDELEKAKATRDEKLGEYGLQTGSWWHGS